MATKKKQSVNLINNHKILTSTDVFQMGKALIKVADKFPTRFLTERDFFPLVHAYLSGRVPNLDAEVDAKHGKIDFWLGGNNPTWLELAVQPRTLIDKNCSKIFFSGHIQKYALYVAQNKSELKKLLREPRGKTRFLLLLDMVGSYDFEKLKTSYQAEGKKVTSKSRPVRVVYVSRSSKKEKQFVVKAKKVKSQSTA